MQWMAEYERGLREEYMADSGLNETCQEAPLQALNSDSGMGIVTSEGAAEHNQGNQELEAMTSLTLPDDSSFELDMMSPSSSNEIVLNGNSFMKLLMSDDGFTGTEGLTSLLVAELSNSNMVLSS